MEHWWCTRDCGVYTLKPCFAGYDLASGGKLRNPGRGVSGQMKFNHSQVLRLLLYFKICSLDGWEEVVLESPWKGRKGSKVCCTVSVGPEGDSETKVHLSRRCRWHCSIPTWISPQEGCTLERDMLSAAERIPACSVIAGHLLTALQQLGQHVLPWRGIRMVHFAFRLYIKITSSGRPSDHPLENSIPLLNPQTQPQPSCPYHAFFPLDLLYIRYIF